MCLQPTQHFTLPLTFPTHASFTLEQKREEVSEKSKTITREKEKNASRKSECVRAEEKMQMRERERETR